MHWQYVEALREAEEGMGEVILALIDQGVDPYDAQYLVTSSPDIASHIVESGPKEVTASFMRQLRGARPRHTLFDVANPKEDPTHVDHLPDMMTRDRYNAQISQTMTPIALALASKIHEENGLTPPRKDVIERLFSRIDWAKAFYETQGMPPKPPPGKVKAFLNKYLFRPLDSGIDVGFRRAFPIIVSLQTMMLMYALIKKQLSVVPHATTMRAFDVIANQAVRAGKRSAL